MEPHTDTSRQSLIKVRSYSKPNDVFIYRFRRFKILGAWTVILTAFLLISLFIFGGLCYGYQRRRIQLTSTKLVPVILLTSGFLQVLFSLLAARKAYKLRYISANRVETSSMRYYVSVHVFISILSLSHVVCYTLLFIYKGNLNIFTFKSRYFTSAGYQPIAIAAANLIAMNTISLVTSVVCACLVCCSPPRHRLYDVSSEEHDTGSLVSGVQGL